MPNRLDRIRDRPRVAATLDFGRTFGAEWRDDRVTGLAAEIAYFGILSLFPALLAVSALIASLDRILGGQVAQDAQQNIVDVLGRVLASDSGVITAVEGLFSESRGGALTLGVLLSVVTASRGFAAVVRALDIVYDLPEQRPWIASRLLGLALAVGSVVVAAVLLTMLVLGPLLGGGREVADFVGLGAAFVTFWEVLRLPFAFTLLVLWATTLFHLAPDHRTRWLGDLPGAVIAAALWIAASLGLRIYVTLTPGQTGVVGVLGGGLTLLLWLWLLAMGLLAGGEVNAILAARRAAARAPEGPDPR